MKVLNEVKKPDDGKVRERKRAGLIPSSAAEASKASDGSSSIVKSSINTQPPPHLPVGLPLKGGRSGGYPRDAAAHAPTRAPARGSAGKPASINDPVALIAVLDQVAKLTRKQSQELLDQLALRMRLTDEKRFNPDLESWSASVHAELNSRLSSEQAYGLMMVRATLGERENWQPIERLMQSSNLSKRTPAQRKSFYMLLAELLVDHAKHEGRKHAHGLTLRNVARCCVDIASIFDWSFPGYLASGLAYIVAEQRQLITSGKLSV